MLPELLRALGEWGVNAGGRNQGVVHIVDYALGLGGPEKLNRLERLSEYGSVGELTLDDPEVIPNATRVVKALVAEAAAADELQAAEPLPGKRIYFVPLNRIPPGPDGLARSTRGMIVIVQGGGTRHS